MILESGKTDYLTLMSAPDHAASSSSREDYVDTPCSKDASNLTDLCMTPDCQTRKSLIFSAKLDHSELSSSDLNNTYELFSVEHVDDIGSTEQFNAE